MSNYGQQPPYGQNPYGQQPNPYGQPQPPYGPPPQPGYGQQPSPYGYPPQPGQGQWVAQRTERSGVVQRAIPVVTLDALPGREVASVVGDVLGVVARSRELPPEQRTGPPTQAYASMLVSSRQEAVSRMVAMAQAAGADAVLGLRFDCSEITQGLSEVSAYGTAVILVPDQNASGEQTGADQELPPATAPSSASEPVRPHEGEPWPPEWSTRG